MKSILRDYSANVNTILSKTGGEKGDKNFEEMFLGDLKTLFEVSLKLKGQI